METVGTPNSSLVDMGGLKLEAHVRTAIDNAWRMTRGAPLASADILRAALLDRRSEAFRELATLFPDASPPPVTPDRFTPVNLNAVPLLRPLADSFSVAEGFVSGDRGMWGRDLIAWPCSHRTTYPWRTSPAGPARRSRVPGNGGWTCTRSDKRRLWTSGPCGGGVLACRQRNDADPANSSQGLSAHVEPGRVRRVATQGDYDRSSPDSPVSFGWSSGNNQSM